MLPECGLYRNILLKNPLYSDPSMRTELKVYRVEYQATLIQGKMHSINSSKEVKRKVF